MVLSGKTGISEIAALREALTRIAKTTTWSDAMDIADAALSGSPASAPSLVTRVLDADSKPPEATFTNIDNMMAYLDAPDHTEAGTFNAARLRALMASAVEESKRDGYTWIAPSIVIELINNLTASRIERDMAKTAPDPAEAMRAKCEVIAREEAGRHTPGIHDMEDQREMAMVANETAASIANAIAALKGNGEGK